MRKLAIIVLLVFTCLSVPIMSGQENVTDNELVRSSLDRMFENLDKTRVPTGLLLDYAVDIVDFEKYDGQSLIDSNYVTAVTFGDVLRSVNSAAVMMKPMSDVESVLESFSKNENQKTNVGIALFVYNYILPNALEDNLIEYDEASETVKDRYDGQDWKNPYGDAFIFTAAPSVNVFSSLNVTFFFDGRFILDNVGGDFLLNFDSGNGDGFVPVEEGQILSVSYLSDGYKELKFKATMPDGTEFVSHSQIYVSNIVTTLEKDFLPDGFVVKTITYDGATISGCMSYKCVEPGVIRKPFIVVEGFDPWLIEDTDDVDENTQIHLGATTIKSFAKRYAVSEFDGQRDLVYIDWDNSLVDIKANAKLLSEFINEINKMKEMVGSAEDNILMGQSMGGLVARYALCKMEEDSVAHGVTTFITHDSPHYGANVPLGMLYFVQQLISFSHGYQKVVNIADLFADGKLSDAEEKVLAVLNSTAARQMLVNYVGMDGQLDNSVHDEWQNDLETIGFPKGDAGKAFRNLAIVNGRAFDFGKVLAGGIHFLYLKGNVQTTALSEILFPIVNSLLCFLPGNLSHSLDLHAVESALKWWGSNKFSISAEVNPLMASNIGNPLSKIEFKFKKKFLWLFPKTYTLFYDRVNTPSSVLCLDEMPGSKYVYSDMFDNCASETPYYDGDTVKTSWYSYSYEMGLSTAFMFVPSASALAVGKHGSIQASSCCDDFYSKPPVPLKGTPFDAYYLCEVSEKHIYMDDAIFSWIKSESEFFVDGPLRAVDGTKYTAKGLSGATWRTSDKTKAMIDDSGTLTVTGSGIVDIIAEKYVGGAYYSARKSVAVQFPDLVMSYEYKVGNGYVVSVSTVDDSAIEVLNALVESGELKYEWTVIYSGGSKITMNTKTPYCEDIFSDNVGLLTVCVRLKADNGDKGALYSITIDEESIFLPSPDEVIVNGKGTVYVVTGQFFAPMSSDCKFSCKINSFPGSTTDDSGIMEEIRQGRPLYLCGVIKEGALYKRCVYKGEYDVSTQSWTFNFFESQEFLNIVLEARGSASARVVYEFNLSLCYLDSSGAYRTLQDIKFAVRSDPDLLIEVVNPGLPSVRI